MNTTEANKLIAEFMEVKPKTNGNKFYMNDGVFWSCQEDTEQKVLKAYHRYAKYHTSWDWLMPVVERIEGLGYWVELMASTKVYSLDIRENETNLPYSRTLNNNSISNRDKTTRIDTTYKAIISFIEWYNQQPKA